MSASLLTERFSDQRFDGGTGEGLFDGLDGVVKLAVQGTKLPAMGLQTERAGVNALQRIDRVHDFENSELAGRLDGLETAPAASLAGDDARARERVQYFRKVIERNLGFRRNVLRGARGVGFRGECDHGAESVFGGLRKHEESLYDIRICLSGYRTAKIVSMARVLFIMTALALSASGAEFNIQGGYQRTRSYNAPFAGAGVSKKLRGRWRILGEVNGGRVSAGYYYSGILAAESPFQSGSL